MTTYILSGGNDRAIDDFPARLKKELPDTISGLSMLSCFFAVPKEEWADKSEYWREWFSNNLGITHYDWADYDNFIEKLSAVDIVYLHGGNTKQLLVAMAEYPDIALHLSGKIVIGSSAGANMLTKNYWSSTFAVQGKGLGIVDANIMVHYGANELEEGTIQISPADWNEYQSTFQRVIGDNEKITLLPEGNTIVFKIK